MVLITIFTNSVNHLLHLSNTEVMKTKTFLTLVINDNNAFTKEDLCR